MKLAYHYNYETFLFTGTSPVYKTAGYNEYVLPQFATWISIPFLDEEVEQAKLDVESKQWLVELKPIAVVAYHKQTRASKTFADKALVTSEYSIKKPKTEWDEYLDKDWVTNQTKKYNAERKQVEQARRAAYSQQCDPLELEARRKERQGKSDEAQALYQKIDLADQQIHLDHPWPEAPEV